MKITFSHVLFIAFFSTSTLQVDQMSPQDSYNFVLSFFSSFYQNMEEEDLRIMLTCFTDEFQSIGNNAITGVYNFQMATGYSEKLFALKFVGTELENLAKVLESCDNGYDKRARDLRNAESHFSSPTTMHDRDNTLKLNDIHIQEEMNLAFHSYNTRSYI